MRLMFKILPLTLSLVLASPVLAVPPTCSGQIVIGEGETKIVTAVANKALSPGKSQTFESPLEIGISRAGSFQSVDPPFTITSRYRRRSERAEHRAESACLSGVSCTIVTSE